MLFVPKKTKFRKQQKGKRLNRINKTLIINELKYNMIKLKTKNAGQLNSKQITTLRQTLNKIIKKKGKIRINIFSHIPVTKKPIEVRMGKGKGAVNKWIAKIKSGTTLCEIETNYKALGLKALSLAQYKIPIQTTIVSN